MMDWSPDRVLNFGPETHRRGLRWAMRSYLLWPVKVWRVVTPEPYDRPLNVLQRAVLRLQLTGTCEHARVGALLGFDQDLVAFVTQELTRMGLLNASGQVTDRGHRILEESVLSLGDMRVGWVFQDTWSGRLLPRFVSNLDHADVESDDKGRAWVITGSKGDPRKHPVFVLRAGMMTVPPPQPLDVLDSARRHRRQERRVRRAGLDLGVIPAEAVQQVSLVSDEPELFHLLTFVYMPEVDEREEEPWYIADPFGYGASAELGEQLEALRVDAQGGLRDALDRMTGEHLTRHRDEWLIMQGLIRDEAEKLVSCQWPLGATADDHRVRDRIVLAFDEIIKLNTEERAGREIRDRIDGAYVKLRQALEQALMTLRDAWPLKDTWRKLYTGEEWSEKGLVKRVVTNCGMDSGFSPPFPPALLSPNPAGVKRACRYSDSSNLRPLCVALLLAAADDDTHPLRSLAAIEPSWLSDFDRIAAAAGGEIHLSGNERCLDELRHDADMVIRLCRQLLTVLAPVGARTS